MEPPPNSCPQLADRCELVGSRMTAVRVVPDNILRGSKPADIQKSDRERWRSALRRQSRAQWCLRHSRRHPPN